MKSVTRCLHGTRITIAGPLHTLTCPLHARFDCSSISHGSAVIIAGGVTCHNPWTKTGAVEVLHIIIELGSFFKSYWAKVEQLPYAAYELVPLKIDDNLYIAVGFDDDDGSTCDTVTASIPELLQSSVKKTRSGRVWHKLPDMPYSSSSINHYQGRLIIFTGDHRVEQPCRANQVNLGADFTDSPLQS